MVPTQYGYFPNVGVFFPFQEIDLLKEWFFVMFQLTHRHLIFNFLLFKFNDLIQLIYYWNLNMMQAGPTATAS